MHPHPGPLPSRWWRGRIAGPLVPRVPLGGSLHPGLPYTGPPGLRNELSLAGPRFGAVEIRINQTRGVNRLRPPQTSGQSDPIIALRVIARGLGISKLKLAGTGG